MKTNWIKEVWKSLTKRGQLISISLAGILIGSFLKGIGFISWIQYGIGVTVIIISLVFYMYFTRNNDDN